jgi:hypothetical protein
MIYVLKMILDLYCLVTSMEFVFSKPCFLFNSLFDEARRERDQALLFPRSDLDRGLKYLGFLLKPNSYSYNNWLWLFKKIYACISF